MDPVDQSLRGRFVEKPMGHRRLCEMETRSQPFLNQGRAIQEEMVVGMAPIARQRPVSFDGGALATADAFHSHRLCYTPKRKPMKARIIKKFDDEISRLEKELKTELPKEIQRARELGDLRENAEYQAAKERQTLVQARISMLRERMAAIALMNLDKLPQGRCAFGSTVHVKERGGETLVFHLVMPEDADGAKGMISTSSPIGKALLNKEEGDKVVVPTPQGIRRFEIMKLVTVHDEA